MGGVKWGEIMPKPEWFQPIAYAKALGPVRAGEELPLTIGVQEEANITQWRQTMYLFGNDLQSGEGVIWPYDPNDDYGRIPTVETSVDYQYLKMLADTYNPNLLVRSPHQKSSRRRPNEGATYDATDGSLIGSLLVKLDKVSNGGFSSDEEQIKAVMDLVQQLEALGWFPPGSQLWSEEPEDDGVEF